MDKQKRNIIINEIRYWKEHKLLPEHYCDFLHALYTKGEGDVQASFSLRMFLYISLLIVVGSFFPITVLVIYFTELLFVLQIVLFVFFMILSIISAVVLYKKGLKTYQIPVFSSSLIFLFTMISLSENNLILMKVLIGFTCFVWFLLGVTFKLSYLKIAGINGAILLFIYLLLT